MNYKQQTLADEFDYALMQVCKRYKVPMMAGTFMETCTGLASGIQPRDIHLPDGMTSPKWLEDEREQG